MVQGAQYRKQLMVKVVRKNILMLPYYGNQLTLWPIKPIFSRKKGIITD